MFEPIAQLALDVGSVIFGFGALADLVFLAWYLRVAKWRGSGIGIMFVLMSVANLAAGGAILAGRVFGPNYPARPYFTLGVFIVFTAAMVVKLLVFAHERAQEDNEDAHLGVPPKQQREQVSPQLKALDRIITAPNRIIKPEED